MGTTVSRKGPRSVTMVCTACGDIDQLNDRSYRRKIAEGKPHVCRLCRTLRDAQPSEADIDWWRNRYSQQQLDEWVGALL